MSLITVVGVAGGSPPVGAVTCGSTSAGVQISSTTVNGQPATQFVGTSGNDVIRGTSGIDVIYGGGGNDTICGYAGNDIIEGEGGKDTISGGDGNDTIRGGNANDKIFGDRNHDVIYGGSGRDHLIGGSGNDEIHGGAGHDKLRGGFGNDTIFGQAGNDDIDGDAGNDTVTGGDGDDSIDGGDGADVLHGNAGSDDIQGEETALGGCAILLEGVPVLSSGHHIDRTINVAQEATWNDGALAGWGQNWLAGYVWVPTGWQLRATGTVSNPTGGGAYALQGTGLPYSQTLPVTFDNVAIPFSGHGGLITTPVNRVPHDDAGIAAFGGQYQLVGYNSWSTDSYQIDATLTVEPQPGSSAPWIGAPSCTEWAELPYSDLDVDDPLITSIVGVVEVGDTIIGMLPLSNCADAYETYQAAGVGDVDVADLAFCAYDFMGPAIDDMRVDLTVTAAQGYILFFRDDGSPILRVEDVFADTFPGLF